MRGEIVAMKIMAMKILAMKILAMKILAMIFGRAPCCHRSLRRAGLRVARVVAERVVVETVADRFARMSRMAARSGRT
jgi:hypothetical protein